MDTSSVSAADLDFGRLALGAANLGNLFREMSDQTASEIVDEAFAQGIRYFDTAPHYGLGLSEKRLGRALSTRPRSDYLISTKVGRLIVPNPGGAVKPDDQGFAVTTGTHRVFDFTEDGIRRSLDESLERLGLDRVDVLYLHDPEEVDLEANLRTSLPALERVREEGLVAKIGIGSKSVRPCLAAVRASSIDLVMLAGRYTLLEQPALEELLPACADKGVGVVNVGLFNSGLLATAVPRRDAHYDYGSIPEAVFERASLLAARCAELGVDLPTAAIQYSLRHPLVSTVVLGARSAEQVRQNADRMRTEIPESFWAELREQRLIPA